MNLRCFARYGLALAVLLPVLAVAQATTPSVERLLAPFEFRTVGPSVTGGRIVDIEVHPSEPHTLYVAAASGGLWKSVNNGVTFEPIFDHNPTISIGDFAIAPSDPNVIWVGTGEHNNQRSAHYGDGVYKSTDGGKTWRNMGLPESNRIGRIAIDARNPNRVFVASSGYLYRTGGERGVYRTTDGGETWELVLRGENDTTGFIEIVQDPRDTRILYACSYDRLRRAWFIRDYGPGSKIYKTTDGGNTWRPIMNGITETDRRGRIGLAIYPKNPRILYATIDTPNPIGNEIYRTDDGGETWRKTHEGRGPGTSYYYAQIRIDPNDPDVAYNLQVQLTQTTDGGRTWRRIDRRMHVDHHAMWVDPTNSRHLLVGTDGGLYRSYDFGETWEFIDNLPIAQFYAIGADNAVPYNVMGGLQDNGVWLGPSRTRVLTGIANKHWINLYGGDGFYTVPDPNDPTTVYTSSQFGNIGRVDVAQRRSRSIRPRESGQRANWMAPIALSPHNSHIVYWGANRLWRSLNRGDSWEAISPDLTTQDPERLRGNVPHCTITTIEESPRRPGVIWVGTDDGNVWVTQNGGATWEQVDFHIIGAPKWWVSRVVASPHDAATAFVSITSFREDVFEPYLYKTMDYGRSWTPLHGGLPKEQISVVRQDTINPNFLVVGTETGLHVSLDGGETWHRFMNGMPTNACQDLLIHEREGDLIVGTHGRGIWIVNVTPLRQLTPAVLEKDLHFFSPDRALAYDFISDMFDPFQGFRRYTAPNPTFGASLDYYLRESVDQDVQITIHDIAGTQLAALRGPRTEGIHRVNWNLRAGNRLIDAGRYLVRLTVGERTETRVLNVENWDR